MSVGAALAAQYKKVPLRKSPELRVQNSKSRTRTQKTHAEHSSVELKPVCSPKLYHQIESMRKHRRADSQVQMVNMFERTTNMTYSSLSILAFLYVSLLLWFFRSYISQMSSYINTDPTMLAWSFYTSLSLYQLNFSDIPPIFTIFLKL